MKIAKKTKQNSNPGKSPCFLGGPFQKISQSTWASFWVCDFQANHSSSKTASIGQFVLGRRSFLLFYYNNETGDPAPKWSIKTYQRIFWGKLRVRNIFLNHIWNPQWIPPSRGYGDQNPMLSQNEYHKRTDQKPDEFLRPSPNGQIAWSGGEDFGFCDRKVQMWRLNEEANEHSSSPG